MGSQVSGQPLIRRSRGGGGKRRRRQRGSVAVHLLAQDIARRHKFLQTRGGVVRYGGSFSRGGGRGRVKSFDLEIVIIPLFSSTQLIIVYKN